MNRANRLSAAVAISALSLAVANAIAADGTTTPVSDSAFKANKQQEKKARFAEQQTNFEQQSRSSASGSQRVDKTVSSFRGRCGSEGDDEGRPQGAIQREGEAAAAGIEAAAPCFEREGVLEIAHVTHGVLDALLQVQRERPVRKAQARPRSV
jgi:hypothetical protein